MKNRLAIRLLWKKTYAASSLFRTENKSWLVFTDTLLSVAVPRTRFRADRKILIRIVAALLCASGILTNARAEKFSINDAISQAVLTNPGVGEASANRRATETELRQAQGTLLPQVRLEARVGPERFDQQIVPPPLGNAEWCPSSDCHPA